MVSLTKIKSTERRLKDSIKELTNDLYQIVIAHQDQFPDTDESLTSFITKKSDEDLIRSFHQYCAAAREYVTSRT